MGRRPGPDLVEEEGLNHHETKKMPHINLKALNSPSRPTRGLMAMVTGTGIGQALTFIALPVLARNYSPSDFGLLAFIASGAAVIAPIATLRLESAFVLPSEPQDVREMLYMATLSLTAISLCVGIITFTFDIGGTFGDEGKGLVSVTMPILIMTVGLVSIFTQLNVREHLYGRLGLRNACQSATITATQLLLIPIRAVPYMNGLVVGTITGGLVGMAVLARSSRKFVGSCTLERTWDTLKRYRRFPLVFGPTESLTLLSQQAPIFVVTALFGVNSAGQLAMSDRIVAVPLALVGLAVASMFEGEIGYHIRMSNPRLTQIYLRVSCLLACVGLGTAVTIWFIGPWFLQWFAGSGWDDAGAIMRVMALLVFTRMVVNPTRRYLHLFGRTRAAILLELLRIATFGCVVVYASTSSYGLVPTLTLLFLGLATADVITWLHGLFVSQKQDSQILAAEHGCVQ